MPYDLDAFLALADGSRTVKEAAAELGVTPGSVYSRAARLRRRGFPARFLRTRQGADTAATFLAAVTGCTAREAAARLSIGLTRVYARAARLRSRGIAVPKFLKAPRYQPPARPRVGEKCSVCGVIRPS